MIRPQRTALIVDDSPEDCETYRRYLLRDQEYQYTIVTASLGQEGLALSQQHQPDIVLLDYQMPDLTGLEFLTQLKARTHQSVLPVVMVTGRGNEDIAVQSMKLGAQDYVVKEQITPETLRLTVNGAIEVARLKIQLQQQLESEQAARAEAESANRAKDDFLSIVSHELRNPLTAILSYAQLLQLRTLDDTKTTRALQVIERSAKAQSKLIEDLIDTARIQSGKIRLTLRSIDLRLVVDVAIATAQLSADEKNVQITSQLNQATVMGDVDRLNQILWNLLANAIKFTSPEGRVEVTLDVVETQAQIRVIDTGRGIRADLLLHVFERFRQGDAHNQTTQGLGLGLAIVHHLVELHGGTVWAESPGEEQGTTLIVNLPLIPMPPVVKLETN